MKKKVKKFIRCNQTWLAVVAMLALLIHNISSSYDASQFSLVANMIIGSLVYSGYLTTCEVKKDKKSSKERHKK